MCNHIYFHSSAGTELFEEFALLGEEAVINVISRLDTLKHGLFCPFHDAEVDDGDSDISLDLCSRYLNLDLKGNHDWHFKVNNNTNYESLRSK